MNLNENYKAKYKLRSLFRWAIMKMFEECEDLTMNYAEVKKALQDAWDDLNDSGELKICEE